MTNAFYLWGSVLSPDFVEGRSDVDLLAISTESYGDWVGVMSKDAAALHPIFRRLDVTIIAMRERKPWRRKPFDRLDPVVILSQISDLSFIWGNRRLARTLLISPTPTELLRMRLRSLRRRLGLHDRSPADEPLGYIVKEMGFICHLMHEAVGETHSFSYNALLRHANADTRNAVELLMQFRHRGRLCLDRESVFAAAESLKLAAERSLS